MSIAIYPTILAAAQPSAGASFLVQTIPLVLIFVIFWFLLIRPQSKKLKEHRAQLAAIKKGDRVVTGGGLIGRVTKADDHELEVEIAPSVKVRALRSTIAQVIDPKAGPAND